MKRRSRTRRVLKWGGTAASIAVLSTLVMSFGRGLMWSFEPQPRERNVRVDLWDGVVSVMWWPDVWSAEQELDALFDLAWETLDGAA